MLGRRWPPTRSASPAAPPAPTSCPPRRSARRPRAALEDDWERALSYGTGIGHPGPLRVDRAELHGIDAEQVMVTNGSMEAAALLFRYMVEPGDRVIVEQPSYDRTLLLLGRTGAELVPVPLEDDGVDVDAFEAALADGPVKLAHVIPNFHNPAGCTLSAAKRERLVELAAEHGFWLFEDDPYRLIALRRRELPPTMLSLDRADRVIHASSFSKTVSPGVRVGYLAGPAGADRDARQARLRALHLAEHAGRVDRARAVPLRRARARTSSSSTARCASAATRWSRRLREQIPEAEFVVPGGGYFLWLDLADDVDTAGAAAPRPRTRASPSSPAPTSCSRAARSSLRLSFASVPAERIAEGVGAARARARVARAASRRDGRCTAALAANLSSVWTSC